MRIQLNIALSFILIISFLACDSNEPIDDDPSNLAVDIVQYEDEPGKIVIQAEAANAVQYELYIGSAEGFIEENVTGVFEYTFEQSGIYQVVVRAYGNSGRYVKASREVTILIDDGVDVDKGYTSPMEYSGYDLVWSDEFGGNVVNEENWVFETGTGCPNCGWGNNELQYYRRDNAWLDNGVLVIEAREQNYGGNNYTSARMKTQGNQSFMYGRVDIRALLPEGQGIWPALWMLGDNISTVGWPACGEIDIMEMIGGDGRENEVHGTLHWDSDGHKYTGGSFELQSGLFSDEYHVFSITWDSSTVKWFVNDTQYHEIDITPGDITEFHDKFFFLFNVAVGGNWPGSPDNTTIFPQQMRVDYIRVFQKQ